MSQIQQKSPLSSAKARDENRPISPLTLSRPENILITNNFPASVDRQDKDQAESMSDIILESTLQQPKPAAKIQAQQSHDATFKFQILRSTSNPNHNDDGDDYKAALFQNKIETTTKEDRHSEFMLDSYNTVLAAGNLEQSNRSGCLTAGAVNTTVIDSGRDSSLEVFDKEKASRLRILQVKNDSVDLPTPNKMHDLSDVFNMQNNNKQPIISRVKSQRRGLRPVAIGLARTRCSSPSFKQYRVDLNQQAFAGDQMGALRRGQVLKSSQSRQDNAKVPMHVQIDTKITRSQTGTGIRAQTSTKLTNQYRHTSQDTELENKLTFLGINHTGRSCAMNIRHSMFNREDLSPQIKASKEMKNLVHKTACSFSKSGAHRKAEKAQKINVINNKSPSPLPDHCLHRQNQTYSTSQPKEHQLKHKAEKRQDFIVKTFTNSLESKVQRQARQKGGSSSANPYNHSTHMPRTAMSTIEVVDYSQWARQSLADNQLSLLRNSEDSDNSPNRQHSQGIKRGGQSIDSVALSAHMRQACSMYMSDKGQATFLAEIPVTRVEEQFHEKTTSSLGQVQTLGGEYLILDGVQSTAYKEESGIDLLIDTMNMISVDEDAVQQASTIIKLDQIKYKDNSQMKKRKRLENRVQNTKAFAQRADHFLPSQGDLGVSHVKLHPRGSKQTFTAQMRRDLSANQAIFAQQSNFTKSIESSIEGVSSQYITMKGMGGQHNRGILTRNSSQMKQATRKILRKRIKAKRKFEKDINESISIRQPQLQRNNVGGKSLVAHSCMQSISIPADGQINAIVNHSKKNKMQSLIFSAKSSTQLSRERREAPGYESALRVSLTSNIVGSLDKIATKSFKIRRQHQQQQHKSLSQIQTASSRLKIPKSALMRQSYNASTNLTVTNGPAPVIIDPPQVPPAADLEKFIKANASHKFEHNHCVKSASQEFIMPRPQTQQNPYNLTLAERESIKDKNRSLISQFQKSELKKQLFEDPRHGLEDAELLNTNTQNSGVLFEIKKKVPTAEVAVGPSPSGRDRQDLLSSQGPAPGSSIYWVESNTPVMRPVQQYNSQPQVKDSILRQSEFGLTQLTSSSRSNKNSSDPTITRIPFKERPSSSKEGTVIMKTVLRNAQNVNIKGNVINNTRISSKGVTTRQLHNKFGLNEHRNSVEIAKFYQNYPEREQGTTSRQFNMNQQTNSINTMEINTMTIDRQQVQDTLNEQDNPRLEPFNGSGWTQEKQSTGKEQLSHYSEQCSDELQVTQSEHEANYGGGIVEETLDSEKLDADQILQLTDSQINKLKFKDVCLAQQVLYNNLTELKEQLFEAATTRKAENLQQIDYNTIQPAKNLHQSQMVERSDTCQIKKKRFTTNYARNLKNKVPGAAENPFSMEQKELRRRISHPQQSDENQLLYGNLQRQQQQPQSQHISLNSQHHMKVKLIGQQTNIGKCREEVNNYFRFKRNQEKSLRRKQRFQQQKEILGQCSPEEVLILAKIKILMDTQNLLVDKAKVMQIEELISLETVVRPQCDVDFSMALEPNNTIRKLQVDERVEQKHLPSAQRVFSSRQSMHKTNLSGEISNAQTLIIAAAEKLNQMNRSKKTRTTSSNNKSNSNYAGNSDAKLCRQSSNSINTME